MVKQGSRRLEGPHFLDGFHGTDAYVTEHFLTYKQRTIDSEQGVQVWPIRDDILLRQQP